jgi:hypothetical protein
VKGYTVEESARLDRIKEFARAQVKASPCNGPYFLHKNGSVMCTGACRVRKNGVHLLGPGQRFMEWNHAEAHHLMCRPDKTKGRRCERCRA